MISLAKRCLTQCDVQVSKLNRFAFALAEVCVRVAVVEPLFGVVLVALLHEACVLSVPKYYPFVEARYASDAEYFKLMVGRCRLTVSKHGLKARLVSALETKV